MNRNTLATLALALTLATTASAQSTEYGRSSAGEIEVLAKNSQSLSGSLGISTSLSSDLLGSGRGLGYTATLGGTLLRDRLWFFGSFDRPQPFVTSSFGFDPGDLRMATAKMSAQLGERQTLGASYSSMQLSPLIDSAFATAIPSSFLSLRYTGVVSDRMLFGATFTRRSHQ